MEKLELYHLHKLGSHDKQWHENAIIKVNENFKNTMYERYQNFTTGVPIEDGGRINLYDRVCQMKINKAMPQIIFNEVEDMESEDRGGFGSTGVE